MSWIQKEKSWYPVWIALGMSGVGQSASGPRSQLLAFLGPAFLPSIRAQKVTFVRHVVRIRQRKDKALPSMHGGGVVVAVSLRRAEVLCRTQSTCSNVLDWSFPITVPYT